MSKGWPDPLHDKGEDFWNFDNMVNEYEWEQQRKKEEQPYQQPKKGKGISESFFAKHTAAAVIILIGLFVLSIFFPIAWIAFFIYLLVALS